MRIRFTWPLFAVLLVAGACAFVYSCRVKTEAFKAGMHETAAKPAASNPAAPKNVAPSASAKVPVKPTISSTPTKSSTSSPFIIVNPQAETITLPGQPPIKYSSFTCNNTGACTYTLQNGQMIVALGSKLQNIINPAVAPSSSTTKSSPAPFVETCPNGEQSTTGCCANGEPQGKYPCCPDGTPSRAGKCN